MGFLKIYSCYVVVSVIYIIICHASDVLRPRGVAISKAPLYKVDEHFTCFDGSLTFPYSYVNDDYCDCPDASDEPGTGACPQGYFHCTNAGYKPKYIRSSLVNDGICDCCDTSDEYNSSAQCVNNCKELGKIAREEAAATIELMKAGYEKKVSLSLEGKQLKEKIKQNLSELEKKKQEALKIKEEKEAIKNEIEEKEKVVLEKYKTEEEERKKKQQEEDMARYMAAEKEQATQYFRLLDKNGDGKLHASELMEDERFDQNRDGTVSEDEAKFFLHMKDYLELEEYTTTGWMIMKPIVTSQLVNQNGETTTESIDPLLPPEEPVVTEPTQPDEAPDAPAEEIDDPSQKYERYEGNEEEQEDNEDMDDYENDEDTKDEDTRDLDEDKFDYDERRKIFEANHKKDEAPKEEETIYDEETQKLVDEAKKARDEFHDADSKVRDLDNEIKNLQDKMNRDYGPDEEFAPMEDQCYEFNHIEYIYKLCPFSRAVQSPKSGGGDTSLGNWGRWNGPEHNKYSRMVFEGGQGCWNGPARSAQVELSCGAEHKLKAVSEPSRCVYLFEFETPAICSKPSTQEHEHDEL